MNDELSRATLWRQVIKEAQDAQATDLRITWLETALADLTIEFRREKDRVERLETALVNKNDQFRREKDRADGLEQRLAQNIDRSAKRAQNNKALSEDARHYRHTLAAAIVEADTWMARVADLEKENARLRKVCTPAVPEPVKVLWEPKSGVWYIPQGGTVRRSGGNPVPNIVAFGAYRDTKEQAEGAAKAMRYFNRLLAYRDEVEPDFYECRGGSYYWVYYDTDSEMWDIQHVPAASRQAAVVYFSNRAAAAKLAAQLTAGEVVL